MRVVLISLYNTRSFPVRTLEACLVSKGIDTTSIFFKEATLFGMPLFSDHELNTLRDLILSQSPDLIGVSLRSSFYQHAIQLTSHLKKQSEIPIVWGGTHAIVCPDECIDYADIVCIGEGENTIVEICERLANKDSLHGVENILFKENSTVIKNNLDQLISDLDRIPLPIIGSRGKAQKIFYDGEKVVYEDPMISQNIRFYDFLSARGCPFACSYCTNSFFRRHFKGKGNYIRQRSVDHVMKEIKSAKENLPSLNLIGANDEIFGMDEEWLEEFCEKYKQEVKLPFHCDMHPAYIKESVIRMLKSIDLQSVTIGVQNPVDRFRRERYKRNTSDAMLENGIKILLKYGVRVHYDFIFDDPLADESEYHKCMEWLLTKPRPFYVAMYSMQYHPKTDYTERLLDNGVIRESDIDGKSIKGLLEWRVSYKIEERNKERMKLLKMIELFNGPIVPLKGQKRYLTIMPSWLISLTYGMSKTRGFKVLANWLVEILHWLSQKAITYLFKFYGALRRIRSLK